MAATGTATYVIEDSTVESETVVTEEAETETVTSTLTETEQIAAYFLEGFREFARKTHLNIPTELGAPDYAGDPDLFLCLVCADIEQLLEHLLINAVHLVLWEPAPGQRGDNIYKVRYRAVYRIERDYDDTARERRGGPLEPPPGLDAGTHFTLIVEWTPNTEQRRANEVTTPPYNFVWRPARAAAFDTSHLTDPTRLGGMRPTVGDLRVTRIEQHTPDDLRRMGPFDR